MMFACKVTVRGPHNEHMLLYGNLNAERSGYSIRHQSNMLALAT